MTARVFVNGESEMQVSVLDRGLNYGDGLFETVLLVGRHAPLWARHVARLASGCQRLGMPMPDPDLLWREVVDASAGLRRAVVRVTVTRGVGERGYAPLRGLAVTRIVSASDAPQWPRDWYDDGIRVRFCRLRLGAQPMLAGIKHLNRLEQVLARAEWDDATIVEGLMSDTHGHVICATAANLFVVLDGRLMTPALNQCGVAGVTRAEVLARYPDTVIRDIEMEELMRADEIFLTSSVRGIVPVHLLAAHRLAVGALTRTLQSQWHDIGLMLCAEQA